MLQGGRPRADIRDVEQALIVRRWRRYGADRLYVTADTGAPLGSVDLATGRVALQPGAAEETLCERLDRLVLVGWHVLHDVPVGRQGSVVAHLLVGPPGAFAVAERPAGPAGTEQFMLDGRHLSADGHGVADLRDVRLAAARAGSLLRAAVGSPVGVRGALVVHGPVDVHDPSRCDALVLPEGTVPDAFADLPARWTAGRVDAVAAVARRRSTWAVTWAV
jgi:hypothetical protein